MRLALCLPMLILAAVLGAAEPAATAPVEPPRLGIGIDERAETIDPTAGLPVLQVTPGTTASSLGVRPGDQLLAINGAPVRNAADLRQALSSLSYGTQITVQIRRAGETLDLAGALSEPRRADNLNEEIRRLRQEVADLQRSAEAQREPTLGELVRQLQVLQEQFPRAAAEFKRLYPNGEFSISVTITSDRTAEQPIDLMQPPADLPTEMPAPTPQAP